MDRAQLVQRAAGVLIVSFLGFAVVAHGQTPDISAEPVPGQLDIMQGTAIKLGGEPPSEGPQPESFHWEIIQGEGATLFNEDEFEAVFQAPIISSEIEVFVVRLTVGYPGGETASNSIHFRVHRDPPETGHQAAAEKRAIEDVMADYYRKEQEARERNRRRVESQRPVIVNHTVGGWYGGYGYRGAGWGWGYGWGWPVHYPVYTTVVVPPPGTVWGPGVGEWRDPVVIPYDDIRSAFPAYIADDYLRQDQPGIEAPRADPATEQPPLDFIDIPN